jgi:hypothetical protein
MHFLKSKQDQLEESLSFEQESTPDLLGITGWEINLFRRKQKIFLKKVENV